jgi:hypothetical protein
MTVHFEDLPLADMMAAFDAKLASQEGKPRESAIDSDTVARARAQLAAAEAEARRRAGGEVSEVSDRPPDLMVRESRITGVVAAITSALRDLVAEPQFRETLRRALRHLPPLSDPGEPEPQPWIALGLTRDVWMRLKKAGKLKED